MSLATAAGACAQLLRTPAELHEDLPSQAQQVGLSDLYLKSSLVCSGVRAANDTFFSILHNGGGRLTLLSRSTVMVWPLAGLALAYSLSNLASHGRAHEVRRCSALPSHLKV